MSLQHSVGLQLAIGETTGLPVGFLNFSSEIYRIFIILALIKCGKDWASWDGFKVFVGCLWFGRWVYIRICVKYGKWVLKRWFWKVGHQVGIKLGNP